MKLDLLKFGRNNEARRLGWLGNTLSSIQSGSRILDAGAGELRNKQYCAHLDYVSQDFCQYKGTGDGAALQTGQWDTTQIDLVSDITAIPCPDASFDVALCTEVLEHVPEPVAALRELCRLVKPGGLIILSAPFCSLTHFAPFHYSSGLSRYWYEEHLMRLGCEMVELTPNGSWFDFIAQEIWRLPWIGRTYSAAALGWLALLLAMPTLAVLRWMKSSDRGSSELLAFGWLVVARRSAS